MSFLTNALEFLNLRFFMYGSVYDTYMSNHGAQMLSKSYKMDFVWPISLFSGLDKNLFIDSFGCNSTAYEKTPEVLLFMPSLYLFTHLLSSLKRLCKLFHAFSLYAYDPILNKNDFSTIFPPLFSLLNNFLVLFKKTLAKVALNHINPVFMSTSHNTTGFNHYLLQTSKYHRIKDHVSFSNGFTDTTSFYNVSFYGLRKDISF